MPLVTYEGRRWSRAAYIYGNGNGGKRMSHFVVVFDEARAEATYHYEFVQMNQVHRNHRAIVVVWQS